jgi:hypothetical protein
VRGPNEPHIYTPIRNVLPDMEGREEGASLCPGSGAAEPRYTTSRILFSTNVFTSSHRSACPFARALANCHA